MKKNIFFINSVFMIIIMAILNTSCFERNDMYDFAKNGVKVIYAINITSDKVYKVTEDGHYNKSYSVTSSSGYSGKRFYPLNDELVAVEMNGTTNLYFHTYEGNSWYVSTSQTLPDGLTGMLLMDNKIIYSTVYNLYSYNGDSWQTLTATITTPPSILALAQHDGGIYILGTDYSVYKYTYSITAEPVITVGITVGTPFNCFEVADGNAYIGFGNYFYYNKLGSTSAYTVVSPSNVQSYAIYNSSAVYAAGYSTQIEIMKLASGTFNTIKTISVSTAPAIVMKALSETKLVLGISASTSHDGLYILDTRSGDLKTITTDPIADINILNY